ncbi:hypothetical protein TNCV_2433641 [Trichonephila clavipes]|nr:hypothetical protein TNCV_2433641 [Trichonephila clavipes]
MWNLIGRRLARDPRPASSKDKLLLCIQAIRNSLPQADIESLFDSIPRRIAALTAARVGLKDCSDLENCTYYELIVLDGDRFNSCKVIYSQFGLAIHQNDHQARRRFVEWAQNEIAVVPDFHKRILFSDEAHFWLNGYVNKQNCRIWSEANPQVYVETPLHPEKLTVWCALWVG